MDYFTYPGVPGRYFRCEAHKANLAETRCVAMYREAKTLKIGSCMPMEKCVACPIGVVHAGDSSPQKKERAIGHLTCARCHQQAQRLVCGGVCVSCKNREWEVAKGKNAKGLPPHPVDRFWADDIPDTKVLVMHRVELSVSVNGKARPVVMNAVADTLEAVLRLSGTTKAPIFFGMRSPLVSSFSDFRRWMDGTDEVRPRKNKTPNPAQQRLFA